MGLKTLLQCLLSLPQSTPPVWPQESLPQSQRCSSFSIESRSPEFCYILLLPLFLVLRVQETPFCNDQVSGCLWFYSLLYVYSIEIPDVCMHNPFFCIQIRCSLFVNALFFTQREFEVCFYNQFSLMVNPMAVVSSDKDTYMEDQWIHAWSA